MKHNQNKIRNLLSVDWDFFFLEGDPDTADNFVLCDWGRRETPLFITGLWEHRAAAFYDYQLPLPGLSGEQENFWSRFQFHPHAKLYTSESHCDIVQKEFDMTREVWNFDAHHDLGYSTESILSLLTQGRVDCSNWGIHYAFHPVSAWYHVVYPRWKTWADEVEPVSVLRRMWKEATVESVERRVTLLMDSESVATNTPVFDAVFVCRSGAWVPPWNNMDDAYLRFLDDCPVQNRVELRPLYPRKFDGDKAILHQLRGVISV